MEAHEWLAHSYSDYKTDTSLSMLIGHWEDLLHIWFQIHASEIWYGLSTTALAFVYKSWSCCWASFVQNCTSNLLFINWYRRRDSNPQGSLVLSEGVLPVSSYPLRHWNYYRGRSLAPLYLPEHQLFLTGIRCWSSFGSTHDKIGRLEGSCTLKDHRV